MGIGAADVGALASALGQAAADGNTVDLGGLGTMKPGTAGIRIDRDRQTLDQYQAAQAVRDTTLSASVDLDFDNNGWQRYTWPMDNEITAVYELSPNRLILGGAATTTNKQVFGILDNGVFSFITLPDLLGRDVRVSYIGKIGNRILMAFNNLSTSFIYASDDGGTNWIKVNGYDGTRVIYNAMCGPNICLFQNYSKDIQCTNDGITFFQCNYTDPGINTIADIIHDGDRFILGGTIPVAGGSAGLVAYSVDGITWSPLYTVFANASTSIMLAYNGKGEYYAHSGYFSMFAKSTDLITWQSLTGNGCSACTSDLIAFGDTVIAAGTTTRAWDGSTWTVSTESVASILQTAKNSVVISNALVVLKQYGNHFFYYQLPTPDVQELAPLLGSEPLTNAGLYVLDRGEGGQLLINRSMMYYPGGFGPVFGGFPATFTVNNVSYQPPGCAATEYRAIWPFNAPITITSPAICGSKTVSLFFDDWEFWESNTWYETWPAPVSLSLQ
jgi:hypothetical protein